MGGSGSARSVIRSREVIGRFLLASATCVQGRADLCLQERHRRITFADVGMVHTIYEDLPKESYLITRERVTELFPLSARLYLVGGNSMIARRTWAAILTVVLCGTTFQPLSAVGDSTAFFQIASCTEKGSAPTDGVTVEIFVPRDLCCAGYEGLSAGLKQKQQGFYALDLTSVGKGKALEPVHLQISKDADGLLVDQYTRGLPVSLVPRGGGIVSFDNRFASEMMCSPLFQSSRPAAADDDA